MKAQYSVQPKPIRKPWLNRYVKICVLCGNTNVAEYDLGLFCGICGTSLYFGRAMKNQGGEINES